MVHPVRRSGEDHRGAGVGRLDGQVGHPLKLRELGYRPRPAELGLVPDDPGIDGPGILTRQTRHELAPVVLRVIERQLQVMWG